MAGTRVRRELDAIKSSKHVTRLLRVLNGDETYGLAGWSTFVRDLNTSIRRIKNSSAAKYEIAPPFSITVTGFEDNLKAMQGAIHCRLALWEIANVDRMDLIKVCYCGVHLFGKRKFCDAACRSAAWRESRRPMKR